MSTPDVGAIQRGGLRPGLARACGALVVGLLTGCAAKTSFIDRGVEGIQTPEQRRQAERFVYNSALDTRVRGLNDERPMPVERVQPSPPACNAGPFDLRELPVRHLRLSNQRMDAAAQMLRLMGYTVISSDNSGDGQQFGCRELPAIVLPFIPPDDQLTFAEDRASDYSGGRGASGFSPLRTGSSEDLDRMIVFYHPEEAEKLSRLESAVADDIDQASPQVFLETLVVEVSKEDSRELGLDWQSANVARQSLLSLGQLAQGLGPSVDFLRNTLRQDGQYVFTPGEGVRFRLKALVESGRAQILSRPSVLALSNRQAVIQIVDVVQTPNLSSRVDINGNFTISDYSFEPLLIGITLNLRPRVSADREWVSMEIDATVDDEVDENAGEVFAPDGNGDQVLLATKPGLSSRKVKTFARIPDRTPIIIGGLAAANQERIKSRVPLLGEIPLVGALFGATDNEVQEREIIIVLTPYVLDEERRGVANNSYLGINRLKRSSSADTRPLTSEAASTTLTD